MPQYVFTVRYSEELLRSSVRRYFVYLLRREVSWRLYLALAVLVGLFAYELSRNHPSWLDGALGALLLFVALFLFCLYRAHLKQALERLRLMSEPVATFTASDSTLTTTSNGASTTLPWNQFAGVLEFDDCWILRLKQRSIFTLPTAGVEPSALQFIRERVSAGAGAV